jgi:hypothetical protein
MMTSTLCRGSSLLRSAAPFLLALGLVVPIGCAGTAVHEIDKQELSKLKEQAEIQTVYYSAPPFTAWRGEDRSPARELIMGLLFGAIGGAIEADRSFAAAKKAGKSVQDGSGIEDAIVRVRDRFISRWQQGMTLKVTPVAEVLQDDDPVALRKKLQPGVVLDFRTTEWGIKHIPKDPSRYQITYAARARLVRVQNSEVLWQGACQSKDEQAVESSTLEEFLADQGALLKRRFDVAADDCADTFIIQLFGPDGLQKPAPLQASTSP